MDFNWDEIQVCSFGNPEVHIGNIPKHTKSISIYMYDNFYSYPHGKVVFEHDGSKQDKLVVPQGKFEKIQTPCPVGQPGLYEITIKAMDADQVVIGQGVKERSYPD